VPHWLPADVVEQLTDFIDITDNQDFPMVKSTDPNDRKFPLVLTQQQKVKDVLKSSSKQSTTDDLKVLTSFKNRYYKTHGKDSAKFIYEQLNKYVKTSGRSDATVEYFSHPWAQPSIIAKIAGSKPELPMVIVGGHEDSINHRDGNTPEASAPGADDDGSGAVTVMEVFRSILSSGYKPTRPMEFQLYAAEEVGLYGSQAMAKEYASKKKQVHGMVQFDMNGYCKNKTHAMIMRRNTVDAKLSNFLALMIEEYSKFGIYSINGSGNSDHASWNRAGYAASHCKEAGGYPYIHSSQDTFDRMDMDCLMEFVNIGVGFAVELDHDLE